MNLEEYFSTVIFSVPKYLTSGSELEYVVNESSTWLELGGTRIDYDFTDLEYLRDYVISFQTFIGTLRDTLENYRIASGLKKVLVSPLIVDQGNGSFEFTLNSDVIIIGDVEIDARVLAGVLDTIVLVRDEILSRIN